MIFSNPGDKGRPAREPKASGSKRKTYAEPFSDDDGDDYKPTTKPAKGKAAPSAKAVQVRKPETAKLDKGKQKADVVILGDSDSNSESDSIQDPDMLTDRDADGDEDPLAIQSQPPAPPKPVAGQGTSAFAAAKNAGPGFRLVMPTHRRLSDGQPGNFDSPPSIKPKLTENLRPKQQPRTEPQPSASTSGNPPHRSPPTDKKKTPAAAEATSTKRKKGGKNPIVSLPIEPYRIEPFLFPLPHLYDRHSIVFNMNGATTTQTITIQREQADGKVVVLAELKRKDFVNTIRGEHDRSMLQLVFKQKSLQAHDSFRALAPLFQGISAFTPQEWLSKWLHAAYPATAVRSADFQLRPSPSLRTAAKLGSERRLAIVFTDLPSDDEWFQVVGMLKVWSEGSDFKDTVTR